MSLLKFSKFFLGLSGLCVVCSLALLFVMKPNLSIDFTGGTLMEISIPEDKTKDDVSSALATLNIENPLGNSQLSSIKGKGVLLRMRDLTNEEHIALISHLGKELGEISEQQFTTIGPTVGSSLKKRSFIALGIASIVIVLYIAFAFRRVPRRLSPWRFGVIAVLTLLHDVIITVGIFTVLSHTTSFEFDTLFVTALLTILGYSVNDTIVIFDRIRDNLASSGRTEDFRDIADRSLSQSITRSINTSVSTLIMLFALFLLGSESIKWFILALIVGAVIGTYSSIFLATPLLVHWRKNK
jgi:preprotein translocase subunit SecF